MKTVEIGEATHSLADYVQALQTEPLVITNQGTPTAVILPLTNVDLESIALSTNPEFIALIERSRARAREEGELSAAEMRRRVLDMPGGRAAGTRGKRGLTDRWEKTGTERGENGDGVHLASGRKPVSFLRKAFPRSTAFVKTMRNARRDTRGRQIGRLPGRLPCTGGALPRLEC